MNFINQGEALNQYFKFTKNNDLPYYGEFRNYFLTLTLLNNPATVQGRSFGLIFCINNCLGKEGIKRVNKECKVWYTEEQVSEGHYLGLCAFRLPHKAEQYEDYLNNTLNALLQIFEDFNISQTQTCMFCNGEKGDELVTFEVYKGIYMPVHASCKEGAYEEEQKAIDAENENVKKLPISCVLAFVGALVGLIPSCIAFSFGWLFGILFALSPICAFFFYKLGKAPLRKYTTFICAGFSLLATVICIFGLFIVIAKAGNVSFVDLIKDPEAGFVPLLIQGLLFDLIGVLVAWNVIARVGTGKVEK